MKKCGPTKTHQPQSGQKQHINIASFNIERAKSNFHFVNSNLSSQNIICLQEHCCYKFEKDVLIKLFPKWHNESRSVDEYDCVSNLHCPTGHGGVATLWDDSLNLYARKCDDGNERILVMLFEFPGSPLCLINCYLPSGTGNTVVDTFKDDIARLTEIILKYQTTHEILVAGDLNEDHFRRKNAKEICTINMIQSLQLQDLSTSSGSQPTYVNVHLGHESHLDHFLVKKTFSQICWSDTDIPAVSSSYNATNSSSHMPIFTTCLVPVHHLQNKSNNAHISERRKFKWNLADPNEYASTMNTELQTYDLNLMDTDSACRVFQLMMATAALTAVPYTVRRTNHSQAVSKSPWFPELAVAVASAKAAHHEWKITGKPDDSHPTSIARLQTKKDVRRVQRQHMAVERKSLLEEISQASEHNQVLFHKLVQRQRSTAVVAHQALYIDGELVTDSDRCREGWATYYQELSTPSGAETEDDLIIRCMRLLSDSEGEPPVIQTHHISRIIGQLAGGKASDKDGLGAEHLKLLPLQALHTLTELINRIIKDRKVPSSLKSSYKLPIPKKNKNKFYMDHYRGITISSILCKVLESVALQQEGDAVDKPTSFLQVGFTHGRSPSMATLLITEAAAEAKDTKSDLYVATLDARKAFDVVSHSIMKQKLYNTDINKKMWLLIDDLYVENEEVIRWEGTDSRSYFISQGVKQGAVLSPTLYKMYVNDLLLMLQRSELGFHIGSIPISAPTCADDVSLVTSSNFKLQAMLNIAVDYSKSHKYELHPTKSTVTHLVGAPKHVGSVPKELECHLGDEPVKTTTSFTHLGQEWSADRLSPEVAPRINSARATSYSLMGAGLHGGNGLDPPAGLKLITTYVLPRLIHGLDAVVLMKKDLSTIDKYYTSLLRQIQGLPQNCAREAIYTLLNTLPVEAHIHKRVLGLFGSITRLEPNNPLRLIALRQLAMKDEHSHSWLAYTRSIGERYGIPLHESLLHPWPKLTWKKYVQITVDSYWYEKRSMAVEHKTSLKWLIPLPTCIKGPHPLWLVCEGSQYHIQAATTRARMLIGRYQTRRLINLFRPDESKEDIAHLLTNCPALEPHRKEKIAVLKKMYADEGSPPPETPNELCSAILNGSAYEVSGSQHGSHVIHLSSLENHSLVHKLMNSLCHTLHIQRDIIIHNRIINNPRERGAPKRGGNYN